MNITRVYVIHVHDIIQEQVLKKLSKRMTNKINWQPYENMCNSSWYIVWSWFVKYLLRIQTCVWAHCLFVMKVSLNHCWNPVSCSREFPWKLFWTEGWKDERSESRLRDGKKPVITCNSKGNKQEGHDGHGSLTWVTPEWG